jgi:hypothetical protein
LIVDNALRLARRLDRSSLDLRLLGENAQCSELVFDLLEGVKYGVRLMRVALI